MYIYMYMVYDHPYVKSIIHVLTYSLVLIQHLYMYNIDMFSSQRLGMTSKDSSGVMAIPERWPVSGGDSVSRA